MSAFEAFSSDLEAEPLQGSGWSPQKILTKMSAFEAFSSNLEAELQDTTCPHVTFTFRMMRDVQDDARRVKLA